MSPVSEPLKSTKPSGSTMVSASLVDVGSQGVFLHGEMASMTMWQTMGTQRSKQH